MIQPRKRLISTLEPSFHEHFPKLQFLRDLFTRLNRHNETHWIDKVDNNITLYDTNEDFKPDLKANASPATIFNGFRIDSDPEQFRPGILAR